MISMHRCHALDACTHAYTRIRTNRALLRDTIMPRGMVAARCHACTHTHTYAQIGHFCATQLCPEDCSGHGRCHALDGTCDCDKGYGGLACSEVLCPNNCTSPNGRCDSHTGICMCTTGYSGTDCSHEPKKLYNESWGVVFALALVGVCTIFIYIINLR